MGAVARAISFALLFGVLFVAVELVGGRISNNIPLLQIVWMRYVVHLTIVLVVWGFHGIPKLTATEKPLLQLLRSLAALVMSVAWIFGFKHGDSPLELASGLALVPAMVLLFGAKMLDEQTLQRAWIAALLSAVAGVVLAYHYRPNELILAALGPISGMSLALYIVLSRALRDEPLRVNMFYTALVPLIGGAVMLPSMWVTPQITDAPSIVAIGALGLLGWIAVDEAVRAAPLSVTASLTNFQLVLLIFGGLIAGAIPAYKSVGAASALFLAAFLIALSVMRSKAAIRISS